MIFVLLFQPHDIMNDLSLPRIYKFSGTTRLNQEKWQQTGSHLRIPLVCGNAIPDPASIRYHLICQLWHADKQKEQFRISPKNNPALFFLVQNNRPLIRAKGLKHRRINWKLVEGTLSTACYLTRSQSWFKTTSNPVCRQNLCLTWDSICRNQKLQITERKAVREGNHWENANFPGDVIRARWM